MPPSPVIPAAGASRRFTLTLIFALLALGAGLWWWTRSSPATIELLHVWVNTRKPVADQVLADYQREHPDIKLQTSVVATLWTRDYLRNATQERILPDVMLLNTAWIEELQPAQNLLPLDELLARDQLEPARLFSALDLEPARHDGRLYALPFSSRTPVIMLMSNLNVLDRSGLAREVRSLRTWAEFTAVSRRLVDQLNPPGTLEIVAWNPLLDRGFTTLAALAEGLGQPLLSPDGQRSLLDSPGVRQAWQQIEEYIQTVYGSRGGHLALLRWRNRFAGAEANHAFFPFAMGYAAFTINGTWAVGTHYDMNPAIRFSAQPLPGINGPQPGLVGPGWLIGIRRDCPHPEQAWQLLRHLTLAETGNGRLTQAFGLMSGVAALQNHAAYRQRYGPGWDDVKGLLADPQKKPITVYTELTELLYHEYLSRRAMGEPLEVVIDRLHERLQSLLNADGPNAR